MCPHRPPPARLLRLLALVLGPLLLGLTIEALATRSRVAGVLLLAEPLLGGLLLYGVGALALRRRFLAAASLAVGTALAGLWLHADPVRGDPDPASLAWAVPAARCLEPLERPGAPVRVMSWEVGGMALDARAVDAVMDLRPDILVLTHLGDPASVEHVARVLPGQALVPPGLDLGIVVRGTLHACGDNPWVQPVGSPGAGVALALVDLRGVGTIPLVAFQGDVPGGEAWPASAPLVARTAAATLLLAGDAGIAAGHLGVPASFHSAEGLLSRPDFQQANGGPTWPQRLGRWPSLPLHRLDRLLAGRSWSVTAAGAPPAEGAHRPLLACFDPRGLAETPEAP